MRKVLFQVLLFFAVVLTSSFAFWFMRGAAVFDGRYWSNILIVSSAYFMSSTIIYTFKQFPGNRSVMSVFPSVLGSFAFVFFGVLLLRLSYSRTFVTTACFVALVCFYVDFLLVQRKKETMAFVPFGKGQETYRLPNVHWVRLDEPQLPKEAIAAIVVDLRSPQLTDEWQSFLADKTLEGVPVLNTRQVEESLTGRIKIHHMYENDLGSLLPSKWFQLIKRFLDIVLILIVSPLVLPVMLITGLFIAIESRGGIFFLQDRVGQGGINFTMYKFRSMYSDTVTDRTTTNLDARVTKTGKFIRKMRIDELPQFYNVLRGEMSLIGPRAEFCKFAENYEREISFYRYRHVVKPGISGWAQVTQGYNFGVEDTKIKLEYDFYYIKHYSFALDIFIFFKTIKVILTGFGAR